MRPFGCPVTILNTIYHLSKFDGKADEGFFVGYSLNSKAFKVFNSRTRIVEENLHIRFSESTPNVVGSGPDWLFDIDALTRTMNYEPIVAGTQSNGLAGTKASDNADQARKETEDDDGSKPSSDGGKKVDEVSRKDSEYNDQEKEDNVNSSNNINVASTNEVNVVSGKTSIELPFDLNMPALEDYSIFDSITDDEDYGAEVNMNNLDTTILVSLIPTIRIHKDHPLDQVIRDLKSSTQTRRMSKNLEEHGFVEEQKKVYVCQPSRFEDPDFLDKVYKVEKALYGLHQAPKAWHKGDILLIKFMWLISSLVQQEELLQCIEKLMHEKFQMSSTGELTFFLGLHSAAEKLCACTRYQVNLKVSHLHAVKRIFRQKLIYVGVLQVVVDKCFGFRINYLIMAFLRSSAKLNLSSSSNLLPSCALVKKNMISEFAEALTPL
ncbi:putative ribonuclease H-like domain-containing protein [Tanacetum coccineum]